MDKKQIAGLIVAAVVFIVVGTVSTLLHVFVKNNFGSASGWLNGADSYYDEYNLDEGYDYSYELPDEDFIGLVEVKGDILQGYDESYYYDYYGSYYDHEWTLEYIDQLIDSYENKGILLYVDSSGGGVYESDELYLKLLKYKEETGRPVWTYMAAQACSGGYYISMASDRIYCNRNGMTGSIGVIMTLADYTEFMDKVGISEDNITSGKNKAMGSGSESLTQEQKDIFQSVVDETYDQFVDVVASGRNMTKEEVRKIGDGRVYTPKQALELNLIDEIATYDEMVKEFEEFTGVETIASASENLSGGKSEQSDERMIRSGQENENLEGMKWYRDEKSWQKVGRPMYYAK